MPLSPRRPTIPPSAPSRSEAATSAIGSSRRAAKARRRFAALERATGLSEETRRRTSPRSSTARQALFRPARAARGLAASGRKTRIHGDYPSRPGAGRAGRRDDHRLRGRAAARPCRAAREELGAARRRRHAALVRLCRLGGARPAAHAPRHIDGRGRRARLRVARPGDRATSSTPIGRSRSRRKSCRRTPRRAQALLDLFRIHKALYEIGYEAANRPAWLSIPVSGPPRHRRTQTARRHEREEADRQDRRRGGPTTPRSAPSSRGATAIPSPFSACMAAAGRRFRFASSGRARRPIAVIDAADGEPVAKLERLDADGFFAGPIAGRDRAVPLSPCLRPPAPPRGRRRTPTASRRSSATLDVYLMAEGSHRRIFERLGAHPSERRRHRRRRLRGLGAECAARQRRRRLQPLGRPPPPDAQAHRSRRLGALHPRMSAATRATSSSFCRDESGPPSLKSDPVGFAQEVPPATASLVVGLPDHDWNDADWMAARQREAGACSADLDLRGASRLVAAQATATAS